jgi:tRNA pseudouridine38-40 synthase
MPRYFLEVKYMGSRYSGFQIQKNAISIQSVVEHALALVLRSPITLTGSSRTDAGVHAMQNYFHFDVPQEISERAIYSFNSILPKDIGIVSIRKVVDIAHARFDALSRSYVYHLHNYKNPFVEDRSWFYPYPLDISILNEAALIIKGTEDFTSFSKRNSQVKTYICRVDWSRWEQTDLGYTYHVKANRFLRGMVRGLVGTMLLVGKGKINMDMFRDIIASRDVTKADFSTPGHGLFLEAVEYPNGQFL